MGDNSKRKAEVLGMPHGTAYNRLRKQILFFLLKKYGENFCYQCGKEIVCLEDLSVEHPKPWLNDVRLFWDLTNIAFSHIGCNSLAGTGRVPFEKGHVPQNIKYLDAPPGKKWCAHCNDYVAIENFGANRARRDGLAEICMYCRSEQRSSRTAGPEATTPHP